jgi:hypothetical protein
VSNELSLATSSGSSNGYIDHNFTNGSVTANGGFKVSVDVTGMSPSSAGQGASFSVGMSTARADTAADALNATSKFQDGIYGGGNSATDVSIADFWVVLRGDGSLVWGGLGNSITTTDESGLLGNVDVGSKTGEISAEFTLQSFEATSNVNYEVFFDGASVGSGSFAWSESNQNYIGLDARGSFATFNNLKVEAFAAPEVIMTSGVSGSDFVVGWPGQATVLYTLQRTDNLVSDVWTNITTVSTPVDAPLAVTNDTAIPAAFYRLVH